MSGITTHVLDAVLGKPVAGISVRLEKEESSGSIEFQTHTGPSRRVNGAPNGWIEISKSVTDGDGRCRDLIQDAPQGVYRITFDTGDYFERNARTSIYPQVSIVFRCSGQAHYHLPLLLSDNSYTTYRGS